MSCKKDKAVPPSLTTSAISEISYTSATSGGSITDDGSAPVTAAGVCWSTSAEPTTGNFKTEEEGGSGAFVSKLTQLNPNTLYYVRAYATSSAGTGYGSQVSFTTNQIGLPALTTAEITSVTNSVAVSGGTITAENGAAVTARGICWSTSENPTISDNKTTDGSGSGTFVSSLGALSCNTKYYVRAYATNTAGTGYGNQVNFTTNPGTPVLSTFTVISTTASTCVMKGGIASDGGANVTARGVCYGTTHNPTTGYYRTTDGTGTDQFYSYLTGMQQNTTYYARPYAINSVGTIYGDEFTITTMPMLTDIQGNSYNVTRIGTQVWMAENLKTTKYNDGSDIPLNTDNASWTYTNTTPGYCWYNNNETANKNIYGALYNWYAVNTGKLCPSGWHIPTDNELVTLIAFVGGENIGGTRLKESGYSHWLNSSTMSTNEFSFTALPGGQRYNSFSELGTKGSFWSNTAYDFQNSYSLDLAYNYWGVNRYTYHKSTGLSVRCIKD